MLVGEGLRKHRGIVLDEMEGDVVLPGVEGLGGDQGRGPDDRQRLPEKEVALPLKAGGFEIGAPDHAGSLGVEVGAAPRVVGLEDVGDVVGGEVGPGDGGFQGQDALSAGLGLGQARQFQHGHDVSSIGGAMLRARGREVVVAIRQPEAALHQMRHVAVRVAEPLMDPGAEEALGRGVGPVVGVEGPSKLGRQVGRERRQTLRLDGGSVDPAGVVVADLPRQGRVGPAAMS